MNKIVDGHVGTQVHTAIQTYVQSFHRDIPRTVTETLASCPQVPGAVAGTIRVRLCSNLAVYAQRFLPDGWMLDGIEQPVGARVADIVWTSHDGLVVVDELKTGRACSTAYTDQLTGLAAGGRVLWGDQFAGVRFVPLGSPQRTRMLNVDPAGALVDVVWPVGMGLR